MINPISHDGTKYFVDNYRFNDKQQSLRIGKYGGAWQWCAFWHDSTG